MLIRLATVADIYFLSYYSYYIVSNVKKLNWSAKAITGPLSDQLMTHDLYMLL